VDSDSVAVTTTAPEIPPVATPSSAYERTRVPARASGSVSFDVHHWADDAAPGLDYTQSTARLNLRVRRLWNQHLTLVARSRGRYEDRAPSYRSAATEWNNRLWELSLSYDNADRPVYLSAGRIVVRQLPSAGYLDGALAELRVGPSVRFGAFGGRRPAWLYPDDAASMSAYGGYVTLAGTGTGGFSVQQTAGAMTEYSGSEVNRSALLLTGHIRHGSTWGFYHTLEADLNTGWRKDAAGQSLSLSRAFASLNFRAARWVRVTASYDNLKPYWTYEYRSTADSLFDNRVRQGFRLTTQWSIGRRLAVSLGSGYRSRSGGDDPTITYLASVRRTALGSRWLSLYLSMAGFDGPFEHGQTYRGQADFAKPGWPRLRTGYGRYAYSVVGVAGSRASSSVDFGADFDLWRTVYSGLWAEHNTGDDIKGWRLQAEIGYRL
jgi:hypothetical protein